MNSPEASVVVLSFDDLGPRLAYAIWRLRQEVFVVEQTSAYLDLDGRDLDPDTRHLLVLDGGEPVGYLRLLDDGPALRIGRVVVTRPFRGHGIADALMRRALAEVGDRPAVLDAQSGLVGWYTAYGFAPSGPEYLWDGMPHVPMARPAHPRTPRPPSRR